MCFHTFKNSCTMCGEYFTCRLIISNHVKWCHGKTIVLCVEYASPTGTIWLTMCRFMKKQLYQVWEFFYPQVQTVQPGWNLTLVDFSFKARQSLQAFTGPSNFRSCIFNVDFDGLQDLVSMLSSCEDIELCLDKCLTLGCFLCLTPDN